MFINNPNLKSLIDKLWNSFWSGGISNPLTAIEQITYLIFMKRLDELEAKREKDAEFTGEQYTSRFSGHFKPPGYSKDDEGIDCQTLRWSYFKHMPANEMLLHIQTVVFPFIKELNGGSPFTHSMENAVFIVQKGSLLVEAIKTIEEIFVEIEKDANEGGHSFQDIQGDVYEMLLSEIATAGKNGQFRTPRHIIKLMAELVAPFLGQKVGDPACGTGGFLLGAYQYIITDLVRKMDPTKLIKDEDGFERASMTPLFTENIKNILQDSFYGFDIDVTMVRLGLMNLMMHGIDQPHIDYKDTLSKSYNENSLYDIVMANPPFTGNIDKSDINEELQIPTTKTELLFVERIFKMLKMGGTAAIIVPQGVLFGSGKAFAITRELIVEKSELKAVITMPNGVFRPYAGVSTAILIFTKGGETSNTWFFEMQNDGYSLDDKRGKIDSNDLPEIVEKFKNRNSHNDINRKEKFFFIPKSEIVENEYDLNLISYKENVYKEEKYADPKVILEKLSVLESQISKEIEVLNNIIK